MHSFSDPEVANMPWHGKLLKVISLINYMLPLEMPGRMALARSLNISVGDFEGIKDCILQNDIDLLVVGPEDPLVNGLRDELESDSRFNNLGIVGPSKKWRHVGG